MNKFQQEKKYILKTLGFVTKTTIAVDEDNENLSGFTIPYGDSKIIGENALEGLNKLNKVMPKSFDNDFLQISENSTKNKIVVKFNNAPSIESLYSSFSSKAAMEIDFLIANTVNKKTIGIFFNRQPPGSVLSFQPFVSSDTYRNNTTVLNFPENKELFEKIAGNDEIRTLDCSNCNIIDAAMIVSTLSNRLIAEEKNAIKFLNLDGNNVSNGNAESILNLIRKNGITAKISLKNNSKIDEETLLNIDQALENNRNITNLNLRLTALSRNVDKQSLLKSTSEARAIYASLIKIKQQKQNAGDVPSNLEDCFKKLTEINEAITTETKFGKHFFFDIISYIFKRFAPLTTNEMNSLNPNLILQQSSMNSRLGIGKPEVPGDLINTNLETLEQTLHNYSATSSVKTKLAYSQSEDKNQVAITIQDEIGIIDKFDKLLTNNFDGEYTASINDGQEKGQSILTINIDANTNTITKLTELFKKNDLNSPELPEVEDETDETNVERDLLKLPEVEDDNFIKPSSKNNW